MAQETLSERIAKRVKKAKSTGPGQNRAIFLAVKKDVVAALEAGWPMKTIWETLQAEGQISFGYDAFRRYVQQLITDEPPEDSPAPADSDEGPEGSGSAPGNQGKGDFTFSSTPDKKDLI
ncbi:MAG: TraK family protein [Thalassolituus sp.]|jgi:hypothetical protein